MTSINQTEATLRAIAAYAEGVIEVTDGMWPPHARAAACREGLRNIAWECRGVPVATNTTNEEAA